ncbi:hypothetical protein HDU67_008424 [Dinochytrium kinnereticum]|nr:hypothetical protein HDU67_008424 [Dinochytrium kinnereticum]
MTTPVASPVAITSNPQDPNTIVDDTLYDILCVGFGPSGLSIAVTLADATRQSRASTAASQPLNVCFIERNSKFTWHGDMLIDDTRMQISFIKDLATMRDPTSRFTFLNYLHKEDRLLPFLNMGTFNPYRSEYNAYMGWVADHFGDLCRFGEEVVCIDPVLSEDGTFDRVTVISRRLQDNARMIRTTRNVILAIGGQPRVPDWALSTSPPRSLSASIDGKPQWPGQKTYLPRVIHASKYLGSIPTLLPTRNDPHRIAVVGGGQSAAEIFTDLIDRYPDSQVSMIFRDEALRPADDSPFVNEVVFDPDRTDSFFNKSPEARTALLKKNKSTNYAVVNLDLIERVYAILYKQRLPGGVERHRIISESEVVAAQVDDATGVTGDASVVLHILKRRDGEMPASSKAPVTTPLCFDAVILCTGYQRTLHKRILKSVLPYFETENPSGTPSSPSSIASSVKTACSNGVCSDTYPSGTVNDDEGIVGINPVVERDYRIRAHPSCKVGVYLQGCCEGSHGLSDTLLSVLAVRGVEVVSSLIAKDEVLKSAGFFVAQSHGQDALSVPAVTVGETGSFRSVSPAGSMEGPTGSPTGVIVSPVLVPSAQLSLPASLLSPAGSPVEEEGSAGSVVAEWEWVPFGEDVTMGYLSSRSARLEPTLLNRPLSIPGPGQVVYRRQVSLDASTTTTLTFRVIDPVTDLLVFHSWMNHPRVSYFWREQGGVEKHRQYITNMIETGGGCHTVPLIGCFDSKPFGYFEVYDASLSTLAGRYDVPTTGPGLLPSPPSKTNPQDPTLRFDRGVHMLVGEERFRGPHRVSAWLPALVEYAFCASPYGRETRRVVSEPRIDNEKMVGYLESLGGFLKCGGVNLGHKTAMLMCAEREGRGL